MPTLSSYNDALLAIMAAREASGLTQSQVAAKIGVRQSTIGNYEAGANRMSVEALIRVANVLGLELVLRPRTEDQDLTAAASRLSESADPALRAAAAAILHALAGDRRAG